MRNFKKMMAVLLALVMVFALVACKNNADVGAENGETIEESIETTPVNVEPTVDTLGWKVNPTVPETVMPADVLEMFITADEAYADADFIPVAYVAQNQATDTYKDKFLCQIEAEFAENAEGEPKLYTVMMENSVFTDVYECDLDMYMAMSDVDATAHREAMVTEGWSYYTAQDAMDMPTAIANALSRVVVPEDIRVVQFIAVHGADDGTLVFNLLCHKVVGDSTDLCMMFMTVPFEGNVEITNVVPIV